MKRVLLSLIAFIGIMSLNVSHGHKLKKSPFQACMDRTEKLIINRTGYQDTEILIKLLQLPSLVSTELLEKIDGPRDFHELTRSKQAMQIVGDIVNVYLLYKGGQLLCKSPHKLYKKLRPTKQDPEEQEKPSTETELTNTEQQETSDALVGDGSTIATSQQEDATPVGRKDLE